MSKLNERKSYRGVIPKGKVNEIIRQYEVECSHLNELSRSRSETSLWMDKIDQENSHSYEPAKKDHNSTSFSSTKRSRRQKTLKEPRENGTEDTIQKNYNKELQRINKNNHELISQEKRCSEVKNNTGAIPKVTSMTKKPIPAPRIQTLPRKKTNNENRKSLREQKKLKDFETILNSTFIEAAESGNIENHKRNFLYVFDENVNEMILNGFDENRSFSSESENLSEESGNENDEDIFNLEDEEPDYPLYVNLEELLFSKPINNINNINQWTNTEESESVNEEDPLNENIDDFLLQDINGQLHFPQSHAKENNTTGPENLLGEDEEPDYPIYINLEELLCYKPMKRNNEVNYFSNREKSKKVTIEDQLYEIIQDYFLQNVNEQLKFPQSDPKENNTKEHVKWNIPHESKKSLKSSTRFYVDEKDIAYNDKSEEENSKTVHNKNFTKINPEEAMKNKISTQRNILPQIVQEFKETELRYFQELSDLIPVYKYGIKNHSSLIVRSQAMLMCGTIDRLLKQQTEFVRTMKNFPNTVEITMQIFINYEELFWTYKQCLITLESKAFVIGYNENDYKEINLPSMLNQRLTHYKMFLERIRNEISPRKDPGTFQLVLCPLNTIEEIINSCNIRLQLARVENVPLRTNDVEKDSPSVLVQCCPFDVSEYGDFLLQNKFNIKGPFTTTLTVFLFNHRIIFATKEKHKFYYQSHIDTNDIGYTEVDGKHRKVLLIQHHAKSKKFHLPIEYKLKAENAEIADKWKHKINDCLWNQKLRLREEVTEQYVRKKNHQ